MLDSDDSTNQLNREELNYNVILQNDDSSKDNNLKKYTLKNKNTLEENEHTIGENISKKATTYHKKQEIGEKHFPKSVVSKTINPGGQTEKLVIQGSVSENINEGENSKREYKTIKNATVIDPVNKKVLKSQISENEVIMY